MSRPFGLVFVLFEPAESDVANLKMACVECSNVVVVDNTPEPDPKLHLTARTAGAAVIANANAGGLAGAYNRGVRHLLSRGAQLIFFLDQDSRVPPGYFYRMMRSVDATSGAFLLGPLVFETALGRYLPDVEPGSEPTLRPATLLISSGSAVSVDAYEKLGPFREDLFIEFVDTEYAMRATRKDVPILLNTTEVLRQRTGTITRHGKYFTTNHRAVRRYYLVRNVVAMCRVYSSRKSALWHASRFVAREGFLIARFESCKWRKLVAVLIGAWDGLRLRLGSLKELRPRVYAFCQK